MAKTLTEVEVKKTTTNEGTREIPAPASERQNQRSWKTLLLAPLALLAVGAAVVLIARPRRYDRRGKR